MTAVAISNRSSPSFYPYNTGASEASNFLQKVFEDGVLRLSKAETWDHKGRVLSELNKIYQESSEKDWDGYGALPVSQEAYHEAVRFLKALPLSWLPNPEVGPEPEGDIGFEWNYGKNRIFVMSINGTNIITYAGLLGTGNKTHGTEVFDGSIPQTIVNNISRIIPRTDSTEYSGVG